MFLLKRYMRSGLEMKDASMSLGSNDKKVVDEVCRSKSQFLALSSTRNN